MAYIGKTNWQNNEIVEASDMNRIEQGILDVDVELGEVAQELAAHKADNTAHGVDTKIPKSLATTADQFLVSSGASSWVIKTVEQIKTLLGLKSAAYTESSAYAPSSHINVSASTSAKGHVQLTDSVSSTSTTTAATPNSVKQAYDKATSDISILQGQIELKVEQTDIDRAINEIEVGGRNLVPNSATRLFILHNLSGSSTLVDESDNATGKVGIYEITDGTGFLYTPLGGLPLKIGEIYTISFYIKADKILDISRIYGNGLSILSSNLENVVTTDYKKVIVTIRKNAGGNNNFHLEGIGENSKPFTVYIHSFQVEKGTKATDWTPAPEDVEAYAEQKAQEAQAAAEAVARAEAELAETQAKAYTDQEVGEVAQELDSHLTDYVQHGVTMGRENDLYVAKIGSLFEFTPLEANYGGNIRAIAIDDAYVYIGGWETKTVKKLNKSNLSQVAESTGYGGDIYAIAVDDNYVYVGGGTTQTVKKLNKSDLSQVAESTGYGGDIRAIAIDDNYVYVGGMGLGTTRNVKKLYKPDLSLVTGSAGYDGDIYAIAVDDNYVYVGGGAVQTVKKLNKSNLSQVAESTGYGGIIYAIAVDDNYVYVGGMGWETTRNVKKLNKSDLSQVAESADYGGAILAIATDNEFVYVGGGTTSIRVIENRDLIKIIRRYQSG